MIYFVRFEKDGPIKIGTTVYLPARLKKYLRVETVLGVHDGGPDVEREVHRRFDHLRLNKRPGKARLEWFRPDPELFAYIAERCRQSDLLDRLREVRPKLRSVRVRLDPGDHALLRMVAASERMSMARYAKTMLARLVREQAREKGLG